MSLSSVELWQRISGAGLAAPMICRSWAAEALQELQPSDAANATRILEQLVRLGRLTDYQADLIAGKRQGDFKRGVWTLRRPVAVPLWEGWFEAVKTPNEPSTWLRWLSSDQLAAIQNAAPSLPRGLRLAQLNGINLQSVFVPELVDKQLQLQVQPIQGVPLSMALKQVASLGSKAATIVRQVAEALKPLHANGLAHGRVLPDRVYWHAEFGVTLARDPICCQTASLDEKVSGVIQNDLNGLTPAQFMAPEFLAPGQLPTPNSDIYSLGCLWWWLVTGKPLVVGSTLDQQLANQAEASIALPKDCNLPPPFARCMQHCLAKNLPARFATAEQLCNALDAAFASVAKGPIVKQRLEKPAAPLSPIPVLSSPTVTQADAPKPASRSVPQQPQVPPNPRPPVQPAIQAIPQPIPQPVAQPTLQPTPPLAGSTSAAAVTSPLQSAPKSSPSVAKAPTIVGPVSKATEKRPEKAISQPTTPKLQPSDPQAAVVVEQPIAPEIRPQSGHEVDASQPVNHSESQSAGGMLSTNQPAAQPIADQPIASNPIIANPTVAKPSTTKPISSSPAKRKKIKRKPTNNWALPVIGGLGAVCVLLGILIFSGVFKPTGRKPSPKPSDVTSNNANVPTDTVNSPSTKPDELPSDPRLDVYRIVPTGKDLLWAPPAVPKPIALDLLPPGGQIFVTLRPKQLMSSTVGKSLLAAFNEDLGEHLDQLGKRAGVAFNSIDLITIAFYAENESLMTCLRIRLAKPFALSALKEGWGSVSNEKFDTVTLLSNAAGDSYYVMQQPLSDAQSVSEFAVGPTALMKEAAELQGAAGPLVSQLGKLWQVTDADADFSMLLSSSFLFSEGKAILASMPKRFATRTRELLEGDSRAALIQMRLEPAWYVETQLIGLSEREAPKLSESLRQRILNASTAVEEWFVSEQPHPYWRPLAIRYPQMLRTLAEQSRFGTEGGAAVANVYLPPEAAANILLSSWIASQEGATLASDMVPETVATAPPTKPLSIEEYLSRKIKLSFDQEPIETALRLVGEEANANLPEGTPQLRFALDGGAFERGGITRNQQLRDFKHIDLPMRDALTAIAKRGNPVTTVKDTREADQRLIWVVTDDPEQAGKQMISLTTRAAATDKNIPLSVEFAPEK